ncbi:MAG TPA: hypothetical protein VKZ53_14355 [Candidatus Angelobacter sp.]|nr:hypothetical protein [Candidatus Angelobacter sp.]
MKRWAGIIDPIYKDGSYRLATSSRPHPRNAAGKASRLRSYRDEKLQIAPNRKSMQNHLRYTGCWPSLDVLIQYPNWVFIFDEENAEGQDETTIKPEDQQSRISEETCFTTADATLADGRIKTAIIRLDENQPSALDVFDEGDWWSVQQRSGKNWETVDEIWLPEKERRPTVSLNDQGIFPLIAKSRLPRSDGISLILSIFTNGKVELIWK